MKDIKKKAEVRDIKELKVDLNDGEIPQIVIDEPKYSYIDLEQPNSLSPIRRRSKFISPGDFA